MTRQWGSETRKFGLSTKLITFNYPPKGRWIVVDIYQDAKHKGIHPPLFTDPERVSCFSIYQIRWKLSRNDTPFFSPFAKQWISKDIPTYGSQSKRAKITIHWFGTVEPRLSGPRLSGLFDYPDFSSGPVFFMNINKLWSQKLSEVKNV